MEQIGIKVTQVIADIVPLYLSEAETGTYPYAVYDYTPEPTATKDGIYKWSADVTITIVSEDFNGGLDIANDINDAFVEAIDGKTYTYALQSIQPECTEGIWSFTMTITINQYI